MSLNPPVTIWSWAAVLTVYLTNACANVSESIKKVLLYCNISFRCLPCYSFYLWPLTGVLWQHRQLVVWLLMHWNRGSVWSPNTVFSHNQERQWLQLLRKIVVATPPLSLWNSDTDVEFPLFCCHWVEARAPISLCPSYLPVCISNLTSSFRGLAAILKLKFVTT